MNDKELLEHAAKAIGCSNYIYRDNEIYFDGNILVWNPLEDDGDALRLAVKLNFCVSQWTKHSGFPPHVMVGYKLSENSGANSIEDHNNDPYAATRRAIVMAAAEIGRNMK